MLRTMGTRAIWMAIGLVLGGSALALAGAGGGAEGARDDARGTAVSAEARADDDQPGRALGLAKQTARQNGDLGRPINHGFYVSSAAHCEDVDDPENDIHLDAPGDCATDEQAHGEYVSRVARSAAGMKQAGASGEARED